MLMPRALGIAIFLFCPILALPEIAWSATETWTGCELKLNVRNEALPRPGMTVQARGSAESETEPSSYRVLGEDSEIPPSLMNKPGSLLVLHEMPKHIPGRAATYEWERRYIFIEAPVDSPLGGHHELRNIRYIRDPEIPDRWEGIRHVFDELDSSLVVVGYTHPSQSSEIEGRILKRNGDKILFQDNHGVVHHLAGNNGEIYLYREIHPKN